MRSAVEQVKAQRIADAPVVEVPAPAVHLRRRYPIDFVDKRREHPRLIPTSLPECGGKIMASAKTFGELLDVLHRHPERLLCSNAKPGKVVPVLSGAFLFQPRQGVADLVLDRPF